MIKTGIFILVKAANGSYSTWSTEKLNGAQTRMQLMDIWSYRDTLPSLYGTGIIKLKDPAIRSDNFPVVINVAPDSVVLLQKNKREKVIAELPNDEIIVAQDSHHYDDHLVQEEPAMSCYLVSLESGTRHLLMTGMRYFDWHISPDNRYLIWFDEQQHCFLSYNLKTNEKLDISGKDFSNAMNDEKANFSSELQRKYNMIEGWVSKTNAVLVYDGWDAWMLDTRGLKAPINITNGYGRRNHIALHVLDRAGDLYNEGGIFQDKEPIIFSGFNLVNKHNGFFSVTLPNKKLQDPEQLAFGPWDIYGSQYGISGSLKHNYPPFMPIKARDKGAWIVRRTTVAEAPNYFLTNDFKSFRALTDLQPQKKHNWISDTLIHWTQQDGTLATGILYKPENFDPGKKYPVIFLYYDKMSDCLNEFPEPGFITQDINVPTFVSNGYLVCLPDFYYEIGQPFKSACATLLSAANYLAKLPYVNAAKMGIQGHSWGGFETNYIVTHSNLFAAAAEGAGGADFISNYGTDNAGHLFVTGTLRTDATLWQRTDVYMENSAVLNVPKVTTPLLMMHNKKDRNVRWEQGLEFFSDLRFLGKKVWMLQYDDEYHGVTGLKDSKDYTIRMTQFFDHYLKDKPAPLWMTQGVPTSLKGIETGLQLDTSGRQP